MEYCLCGGRSSHAIATIALITGIQPGSGLKSYRTTPLGRGETAHIRNPAQPVSLRHAVIVPSIVAIELTTHQRGSETAGHETGGRVSTAHYRVFSRREKKKLPYTWGEGVPHPVPRACAPCEAPPS